MHVNLRQDSITGTILAATAPVSMPDAFSGHPNFLFASPVSLVAGATYFFQPVVDSGDSTWAVVGYNYNYPGGTAFLRGGPNMNSDLWFREGIVVPEPASSTLLLTGIALFLYARHLQTRKKWHH